MTFLELKYNTSKNIEAKQVGIVYHFTSIDAIKSLLNKKAMREIGCDILTFGSLNSHFSTTRNYYLTDNPFSSFNTDKYSIRIAFENITLKNTAIKQSITFHWCFYDP